MSDGRVNRISGHVVLGLSLFAMLLVLGAAALSILGRFDPSAEKDEGTAAHLFQVALVLLLPAGMTFLAAADWERPGDVGRRLAVPGVALVIAFSALYYMEHLR